MNNEEKGIIVEQTVQAEKMKYQGKLHEQLFLVLRFIYLLMGTIGIGTAFTATFHIPVIYPVFLICLVIISIFYVGMWNLPAKARWAWLPAAAVYILLGFIFHRDLVTGLANCYNLLAQCANDYYGIKMSLAAVEVLSPGRQLISLIYVMVLLSGLLSLGTVRVLDGRITALAEAIPLIACLATGVFPVMISMLLMTAVLIGVFSLQYTRYRESFSVRTVTVRMGNSMFAKLRWQTAAMGAGLFLLLLPVSYLGLGPALTESYEAQESLREDIRDGEILKSMKNFWKKLTRGEWDWLPFDIIRSSGVHGGKLSNVKEVREYDETHLYVDISGGLEAPLYVRGYIGSRYTGSGWKELSGAQNKLGTETGESVISLSDRYYNLLGELYHNGDASVVRKDIVITVADANSAFSYIPYGSNLESFSAGNPFDAYTKEDTDREILTMYYMNTQRASNINKLAEYGALDNSDAAYRAFADENYLQLPQKGLDQFYAEYSGKQFASAGDCVNFIRSTLESHAEYTMTPGSTPRGKDYTEYFLYENKQGLCTHYATAAVLMFRLYGIPARYVEGYYITSLDSEQGAEEIRDSRAHAWPEIYIDGAGWVPVEVTPGFISPEDLEDKTEDSTISEDNLEDVTKPDEETQSAEEPSTDTPEATVMADEPTTEEPVPPPTQPTQPTQPPTQPQQTPPSPENNNDSSVFWNIFKIVLIVFLIILILALAAAAFFYQRSRRLIRHRKLMRGEPKAALKYIFRRMDELCLSQSLHEVEDIADISELAEVFPEVTEDELIWLQNLHQELIFSNHTFDEETRDRAAQTYTYMASVLAASPKWYKRIWYRYIKCAA